MLSTGGALLSCGTHVGNFRRSLCQGISGEVSRTDRNVPLRSSDRNVPSFMRVSPSPSGRPDVLRPQHSGWPGATGARRPAGSPYQPASEHAADWPRCAAAPAERPAPTDTRSNAGPHCRAPVPLPRTAGSAPAAASCRYDTPSSSAASFSCSCLCATRSRSTSIRPQRVWIAATRQPHMIAGMAGQTAACTAESRRKMSSSAGCTDHAGMSGRKNGWTMARTSAFVSGSSNAALNAPLFMPAGSPLSVVTLTPACVVFCSLA
ncbi:hypothetical protein BH23GEM9_BH23GEM9_30190 [soil metagenome]